MEKFIFNKDIKVRVFNHTKYTFDRLRARPSSAGENLSAWFKENYNLTEKVECRDYTANQIKEELDKAVIICVASHGIIDKDKCEYIEAWDKRYKKEELWKPFATKEWHDKPKLFFIQTCRGLDHIPSAYVSIDASFETPTSGFHMPKYPNLFIFNATHPGAVSYKSDQHTVFLDSLIENLKEYANSADLLEIACRVNNKVAEYVVPFEIDDPQYIGTKQMSCFESTLTKQFYFLKESWEKPDAAFCYDMQKEKLALIFYSDRTNFDVSDEKTEESVIKADMYLLNDTLKGMDFDVKLCEIKDKTDFNINLRTYRDYEGYNMLLVIFIGHGQNDKLHFQNGNVNVNTIWQPFLADMCPNFKGKPKVFLISAYAPEKSGTGICGKFPKFIEESINNNSNPTGQTIPTSADILIVFETASGSVKYKDENWKGSPFFKYFCEEVIKDDYKDMCDVIHGVTNRLYKLVESSNDSEQLHEQMPLMFSTLRKLIPLKSNVNHVNDVN